MLNRALVLQQMQHISDELFIDNSHAYDTARESFKRICADPTFAQKISLLSLPWLVPSWTGPVDSACTIASRPAAYTVLAVDGSQIYPDRHQGTACFLINIGSVLLRYGPTSSVKLASVPFVFAADAGEFSSDIPDVINARRQELEFQKGVELAQEYKLIAGTDPFVFLFDGSLIFWHLESKDEKLKKHFLQTYITALEQLYRDRVVCAGYISMPKNKELINLIRVELCKFNIEGCTTHTIVDPLVDTTIAGFFLDEGQRSTVFKSNATISTHYPPHLAPYFFYMDVGSEIGRVEIPAWVAQDTALVDMVASIMLDQAYKGYGYPIAIAESHEQAVVKGPDREFFYHLITKLGIEKKQRISVSLKSMRKRRIGV